MKLLQGEITRKLSIYAAAEEQATPSSFVPAFAVFSGEHRMDGPIQAAYIKRAHERAQIKYSAEMDAARVLISRRQALGRQVLADHFLRVLYMAVVKQAASLKRYRWPGTHEYPQRS